MAASDAWNRTIDGTALRILQMMDALEYTSIDDATAVLLSLDKGTIMVKRDLSDDFRHIPIAPSDWWLLGFFWNNAYWIDRFLPFGLRKRG